MMAENLLIKVKVHNIIFKEVDFPYILRIGFRTDKTTVFNDWGLSTHLTSSEENLHAGMSN